MSEGGAEGAGDSGGALSDGQFGDVPDTTPGDTAQNPGDGVFGAGFYPWYIAQRPYATLASIHHARRRKTRKRHR